MRNSPGEESLSTFLISCWAKMQLSGIDCWSSLSVELSSSSSSSIFMSYKSQGLPVKCKLLPVDLLDRTDQGKSCILRFNRNVKILFGIENRLFTVRKSSLICSTSFILIRYDLIIPIILEKSNWIEQNRFDSNKSFLDHFKDCLKI